MKRKDPDKYDNIKITAAQPDRIPSEMDSTQHILPPVCPSEDPKERNDLRLFDRHRQ
ncbi:MAG: hypothetical protein IKN72_02970 [Clostridia bacterium]|nr:hypothetical protein [Clostridia bacterium]MBR3552330.1 hypothetical protein [Clostridia bacterium]